MTSFQEQWAPTWEVQKTIPGAKACIVENTGRTYKSGRPIIEAVFYDGSRRELCRRQGMTLTSKKGADYTVCRKDPDPPTQAPPTVEDVFDDL
jgi:hypothetical protein